MPWGNLKRSAIDKQPQAGPIRVTTLGLVSDEQADQADHGGTEQALYAYAREDLDRWGTMMGRDLRNGQFGENLTVEGIELTHATIGERWRIGSVLIELDAPRIPCSVFQGFVDELVRELVVLSPDCLVAHAAELSLQGVRLVVELA